MIKEISFSENSQKNILQLSKGAFMTTKCCDKVNTMTIGWGAIGVQWGKPIFTAMVRGSRYTFGFVEETGEFTISIPYGDYKKELGVCGSKSGRDTDKIKVCGLGLVDSKEIAVPALDIKGMGFECRVVYKSKMCPDALDGEYDEKWYSDKDYHTIYYGEILRSFIIE